MITRSRLLLVVAICVPLLAFVSLAAWSLSSPPGSSPDDDFHLASIWCGLGERPGLCEDAGDGDARLVPEAIANATCFRYESDVSGACTVTSGQGLAVADRANVDGLYPRVFYGVMSIFASPDVPTSVLVIRISNSLFAVGLLTAAFWALPPRLRPVLVVSVLVTAVPLGVFILASTNPSSWALLAASTVWICFYGALRTTGRRRALLVGLTVLATVVGAGARADAGVFAAFAAVLVLVLSLSRRRSMRLALILGGAVIAIGIGFYLSARQGAAVVTGLTGERPPLTAGDNVGNLLNIPELWTGIFAGGTYGLGWRDTPMPAVVTVLGAALLTGAVMVGLARLRVRRAMALVVTLAALWMVPFVLLYQSRAVVGVDVQPRYILPLMVILVGVAVLRAGRTGSWRSARLWVTGAALSLCFAIALHININRYTSGLDEDHVNLNEGIEWWWSAAPSPMVVWVVGSLAFAGVFGMLIVADRATRSTSREVAADESVRA